MLTPRRHTWAILAGLFLSGAAGLMHEVVWARLLARLIGSTAHAHAVVLAVFMGGLAWGAVLFGRRSDRGANPLRTYVVLELAVALYSLVLPWLAEGIGAAYAGVATDLSPGVRFGARFVLAIALILAPAVWMGGTLPILARHLVDEIASTRRHVAHLYTWNNFGAVLGSGAAGFLLLPALGLHRSIAAASALNLLAALLVGWVWLEQRGARATEAEPATAAAPATAETYGPLQYRAALVALFLGGFAAMGYEIVFLRVIGLAFGSSTYSFTVMLMAFITGIAIGSALIARARVQNPVWWLALSQVAVVVSLVATTPLVARLPYWIGLARIELGGAEHGFELFQATKAGLCLLFLLLPTVCIGTAFPLVAAVRSRSMAQVGSTVGATYAWNTVGNVLGVLVTALVLIPGFGSLGAFHINLALSSLGAGLLLVVLPRPAVPRRLFAAAAAAASLLVYASLGTAWIEPVLFGRNHLRMRTGVHPGASEAERAEHPSSSFEAWRRFYVVREADAETWFHDEDPNVSIVAYSPPGGETSLLVNTKPDASTISDLPTQLLVGHVPLFFKLDARDVFVLGHGSGITAGAVLTHPIERMDVLEISSSILAADVVFAEHNRGALADPRTNVIVDDGRTFLHTMDREYDVIISEPSNPWVKGMSGMFTREYFQSCRDRLRPGGTFLCWFHETEQAEDAVQLILRTVQSVFPHVHLFHVFNGDAFVIGSSEPLALDFDGMERRFEVDAVRADLARMGVLNLGSLLVHHVLPTERMADVAGTGPVNTDDHERLEFLAPRGFFAGRSVTLVWEANQREIGGVLRDGLLDAYVARRSQGGVPFTPAEFEELAWVVVRRLQEQRVAASDLRVFADALRRRVAPVVPSASALPVARGGVPELDSMAFEEAWYRATIYRETRRPAAARACYERALELRPDHPGTVVQVARMRQQSGDLSGAIELLEGALEGVAGDRGVRLQLARARYASGDLKGARAVLDELRKEAADAEVLLLLAEVLERLGKPQRALMHLQEILSAEPGHPDATLLVARLLVSNPDARGQLRALVEAALARHPDHPRLQRAALELQRTP